MILILCIRDQVINYDRVNRNRSGLTTAKVLFPLKLMEKSHFGFASLTSLSVYCSYFH